MTSNQQNTQKDDQLEAGPGASDGTSGGGAGSGVPDAEVGMRVDVPPGDVRHDREKLFPDQAAKKGDVSDQQAPSGA